ncbi:MAG TPA: hypothetical protein VIK27_01425 [Candidatus Aquilonibacter sp.]
MTTVGTILAPSPWAARSADAGSDAPSDTPAVRDPNLRGVLAEELAAERRAQERLLLQRQRFDLSNQRRAELIREEGAIRDMLMAFLKDEDANLKKWIELI